MEGSSSGNTPPPVTNTFIHVGSEPVSMAYDQANRLLYVLDYSSDSVSVVNTTANAVVANITVGQSPTCIMLDPQNQMIYVTNLVSSNISVIDTNTNAVAYSIDTGSLSSPQALVYNPENGLIYALDIGTANLSVINPAAGDVVLNVSLGQGEMLGLAFDPVNRFVYVTDAFNNTVLAFDTTTNHIAGYAAVQGFPEGIGYDPSTGYLYVSNTANNTVSILETSPFETVTNVSLPSSANALAWNPFNGFEYACSGSGPNPPSGVPPDMFLIDSNLIVNQSMNIGGQNVSLTSMTFNTAYHTMYVSDDVLDLVWVISLPVDIHKVDFTESNLPAGTTWYVNLSNGDLLNSGAATVSVEVPQGTYVYSIATGNRTYMAKGGLLLVRNSSQTVLVDFLLVTYKVVFTVSDLPTGTEWTLLIPGHPGQYSNNSTAATVLPNGTYAYVITTGDRSFLKTTGNFNVTGSSVSIAVSIRRVPKPFYSSPLFIITLSTLTVAVAAVAAVRLRRKAKL